VSAPETIVVPGWPPPRGYANAMVGEGRVLFVAGQIGWRPDGTWEHDDLAGQLGQALANVIEVVRAAGGRVEHLASLTLYVTDIDAYRREHKAIGAAYRAVMGKHFPAMALVAVSGLVEPRAVVEIQAHAILPSTVTGG
jgi:enamine deaminase RidA (YjgF/YER057c/UK114 family)